MDQVGLVAAETAVFWIADYDAFLLNGEAPIGQESQHVSPTIGIHFGILRAALNDNGTTTQIEHLGHGPKTLAAEVIQLGGSPVVVVHEIKMIQDHLGGPSIADVCVPMGLHRCANRRFAEVLGVTPVGALHTFFPGGIPPLPASSWESVVLVNLGRLVLKDMIAAVGSRGTWWREDRGRRG